MPKTKKSDAIKDEELESAKEIMNQLMTDVTVPRNIRGAVEAAKKKLEEHSEDVSVTLTSAIYLLDDISNDINMPAHARTEMWSIISMLEAVKERNKTK